MSAPARGACRFGECLRSSSAARRIRDARDVMSAPKRGACRFGECLRSSSAVRRIRDARDVMSAPKRPRRNVKCKI